MADSDQNTEAAENEEETTEQPWWIQFEPIIIVGAVVLLVLSVTWFVNDPSYEPLTLIVGGITTLLSINSVKNKKVNWLLAVALIVTAVVGITIIRQANDPDEIVIVGIFYDGEKDKEGDEYVVIRNEDTKAIQLEGWTLHDDQSNHVFTFPRYELQPGEECRIYTDEDHPKWCGFNFRNGGSGVWNNDGDMATLRNADGELIDESIDRIITPDGGVEETAPDAVILATPTLTANYDDLECIPRDTPREVGLVVGVIDGRTIDVELGDGSIVRVRYLGIATIVKGQPLYRRSVEINKEMVLGKYVTLVEDPEGDEAEGILLRFVFVEDSFVNRDLIHDGYAVPDDYSSCLDDFINMHIAASESDAGFNDMDVEIYGDPFFETPPPDFIDEGAAATDNIEISKVFNDGEKGQQEPDEYIEIRNKGMEAIQLKDWSLSDESKHIFVFPSFIIEPGQRCRIYTNEDHSDWCGFNYESLQAIWGNKGDCATLRDSEGSFVDQSCYK